jgi:hypothetical protein
MVKKYGSRIPVVLVNGQEVASLKIRESLVREAIQKALGTH